MNYLFLFILGLFQLACAAKSGTYNAGWPVGDATWKQTDSDFEKETGISQYRLFEADGLIYKYQLDVIVSEVQGTFGCTYYFIDATDQYSLTVFLTGEHTVSYNSDDPYILMVKATDRGRISNWASDNNRIFFKSPTPCFIYAFNMQ
ncbi:hypothetical protein BO83DRAFT_324813 [Aspergillus eucalypticola CBS 122712]|uniref:Uncharacterized protein n=1 Tax=Aspergillus eucalypticola (strain CBS 122712 / IBT 29274) TaxID=1448314 RepID=A0A317USJ8_ASPEC|nr:uncharacterized protein BO83DRAFT_324813 [Aspergillus eucalypticola CBS 122712]PWY63040.1 hypothetical protein BO83DRAFT_324813 [Aspergillus eucalypticola CBS 122712]